MSVGAALVVTGVAGPASAHGKQEPEPAPKGKSCLELADLFQIDQDWTELKIDELPGDDFTETYDLGGGESVEVTVTGRKYIAWESTIGIDAVYVQGENDEQDAYFYFYEDEETSDDRLGTKPWDQEDKNKIESISFCYDNETPPPTTAPPTTVAPTTIPEETTTVPEQPSTTVVEETTTTTEAPSTTVAPTTAPSTTVPDTTGDLPHTGSNTGLLAAVGVGLLALGGVLLATKRQLFRRFTGTA